MKEIWKDIPQFKGIYKASNLGNIKHFEDGLLRLSKMKTGYLRVYLKETKERYLVHRLIAQAFLINPQNKRTINHINGIKTDNRISNIEYATDKENLIHALKTGLREPSKGYENPLSKEVCQYDLDDNLINKFGSIQEAFRETKIRHISEVCNGIRKIAGGYIWKFKK